MFKWQVGRQNSDYLKLRLWNLRNRYFLSDCYLLKFKENCVIAEHKDKVESKRHFRLNCYLHGDFRTDEFIVNLFDKIVLFRPDQSNHSFLAKKACKMLSIGFAF